MTLFGRLIVPVLILLVIYSCSRGEPYLLGPQMHGEVEILVEIRPGAPTVGMNEFLVMATHKNRLAASKYVVSIRLKGDQEWQQSIQDGATGVYRRAIRVNNPGSDALEVQLVAKDGRQRPAILEFPLIPT